MSGKVGQELEPAADAEALGMLAITAPEVTDEACHDIALDLRQRRQKRPRVASAEEAACVRDPKARRRRVLEPLELLEIGAVTDHAQAGGGPVGAHLLGDRLRCADDGVRALCDGPGQPPLASHVAAPLRVASNRVAQVGDPRRPAPPGGSRTDEVNRPGRRGRQDDVDRVIADDAACRGDRGQIPEDSRIGHECASECETRLSAPPSEAA